MRYLFDVAPSVLIDHLHDKVNKPSAFVLDILNGFTASCPAHGEPGQAAERISGAVGMDGSQRPAVSCVQHALRHLVTSVKIVTGPTRPDGNNSGGLPVLFRSSSMGLR